MWGTTIKSSIAEVCHSQFYAKHRMVMISGFNITLDNRIRVIDSPSNLHQAKSLRQARSPVQRHISRDTFSSIKLNRPNDCRESGKASLAETTYSRWKRFKPLRMEWVPLEFQVAAFLCGLDLPQRFQMGGISVMEVMGHRIFVIVLSLVLAQVTLPEILVAAIVYH